MNEVLTDANTETESSTASQDASAESSTAETTSKETQKSLLQVVEEAAAKSMAKEKSSNSQDEEEEGSVRKPNKTEEGEQEEDVAPEGETEDDDEGQEDTEEDESQDVPFHNHPRWKEVVTERDTARTKVAEYETRVKELEPIADAHKSVVDYCSKNGISADEYRQALEFVALLKSDPAKAREKLMPVMEGLSSLTGDKLPADLQAEVDNNLLPQSRAQEIAKLRAQSTFESTKHKQSIEQIQADKMQRFVKDSHVALQSWESAHRKTDLDFAPKSDGQANGKYEWYIMEMKELLAKTPPESVQDVINLSEKAYDSACKSFSRYTNGRKTPSKVMPSTKSSKTKQSQPKSIADVVKQTAARHGIVMDEE